MKMKVKIDGQIYDVEIGNISERPITASVDGELFEVWPESNMLLTAASPITQKTRKETPTDLASVTPAHPAKTQSADVPKVDTSGSQIELLKTIKAPIPGVITAILVQPGADVSIGQELCKLEAMKMNNSIRSSRAGKISSIHVSIGQHVKHNDVLLEYAG